MKKLILSFTTFIDIIVYLIIALTTIKYLFSLSYSSSEPLVIISFFNGIIIFSNSNNLWWIIINSIIYRSDL